MANHALLETISLTQPTTSVTFDNIPQTGYTDLKIVLSVRDARTSQGPGYLHMRFNGLTTGYASVVLYTSTDDGSVVTGSRTDDYITFGINTDYSTSNTFCNGEIYIPNAFGSVAKTASADFISESNNAYQSAVRQFTSFRNTTTSAITSVTLYGDNNLLAGSTFALYGVAATGTTPAVAPKATGGNIVATDGTYWYHAFTTSGNFIPQTPVTCDAIVVGAGGGGGSDVGGGGGAGRVYALSTLSLTQSTNYTCTVGAGGTRGSNPSAGIKGSDSTFTGGGLSYLSLGGGGGNGRSYGVRAPNDGWNGGGGGYDAAFGATAGNGGNAGGATTNPGSNPTYCGGGGGAAEVGNTDGTGQGGDGTTTYASWLTAINSGVSNGSTLLIAGGGGGGMYGSSTSNAIGGDGGGGLGGDNDQGGGDGIASTGSGGGGGGSSQNGGAGGSGLIVIRYLVA